MNDLCILFYILFVLLWKKFSPKNLILTEALVLSLAGGLIGILLSFGITYILNTYTNQAAYIKPQIVLLAFSFAGIIGVFFGFYPARKAANLNPIDALRYE